MGQMGDGDQLERAFAGATVHDMFNFMAVAILLPVEVITGYLNALTWAIVRNASPSDDEKWEGPVKKWVAPLGKKIIIANKKLIKQIAENSTYYNCNSPGEYYPTECDNPDDPTKDTCKVGLVDCDKETNACPAFFQVGAEAKDDKTSGGVVFVIAIVILFFCLIMLVTILQKMLLGMSTRIVYKATDINGYVAIVIGAGITMLVQSSSITTSTLTPLVGMGVLRLEQMYPLTLGANIGTTMTGILAALVTEGTEPLQVALAHLFFNITGILIFYPIPFMRKIPLYAARRLGKATRIWRGFPLVYIAVMFLLVPMLFLGISALFAEGTKGFTVLGAFITILIGIGLIWLAVWCQWKGGRQKCSMCMHNRERKRLVMKDLPDDMKYLKDKMAALIEHTGLPVEEEEEEETEEDEEGKALATSSGTSEEEEVEA